MEDAPQERLIQGDERYLGRFVSYGSSLDAENVGVSIDEIVDRVQINLDAESSEIVIRRLLGQSEMNIANEMQLELSHVRSTISVAPSVVMHPSHNFIRTPFDAESKKTAKAGGKMSAYAIAKKTGLPRGWVLEQLRSSNLDSTEDINFFGNTVIQYDSADVDQLIEELIQKRYEKDFII